MKQFLKILFFVIILPSIGMTEERKGLMYEIGKTDGKPIYVLETNISQSAADEKLSTSSIKDSAGQLLMTEKANLKNDKIYYQYVEQLQIGEAYELSVKEGKATFKILKLKAGQAAEVKEVKTVSVGDDFMMGPMTESIVQSNWNLLKDGKKVQVDFGVLELSKTVGFEFKKTKETEKILELQMKPSNFLISMLVNPMTVQFDLANKKMVHFLGRTSLKKLVDGKWQPVDAEIIYQ